MDVRRRRAELGCYFLMMTMYVVCTAVQALCTATDVPLKYFFP